MTVPEDIRWMKQALREAALGWGTTNPNPLVGAVVVKHGKRIGRGHHIKAGCAHAEINAIADCVRHDLHGATIYVTLEPCCTTGRTPPCTEAIIKAGFSRVVFGCTDPNPKHAGRAAAILREHGIMVDYPVCERECQRLNEPFFKWITTGRPYVLLKMAQTLDGKIATKSGKSQWITGEAARRRVQKLRQRTDAVMAGIETFRLDLPRFTVRDTDGNTLKTPRRIIVTHHPEKYRCDGFEFVSLPDRAAWDEFLQRLGSENISMLLIEGGGGLAASALQNHAVDRIEFHIAPKLLGGAGSRSSIGGTDPLDLKDAYRLDRMEIRRYGDDIACSAAVIYADGKEC